MELTEILQYAGVGGGTAGAAVFAQWKINEFINKRQDTEIKELKETVKELGTTQIKLKEELAKNTSQDKLRHQELGSEIDKCKSKLKIK